jgi:hypothetical protein
MLTVPVRTVRTGHVSGPYDDTWQVRTGDVAAPGDDTWQVRTMTWQVPYRTRGSTRRRHVSGSFGILGVRLDQSRGDMCHHWKGDMWHGMTSAAYVADDVSSTTSTATRGSDVGESAMDTWHLLVGWRERIIGRHVACIDWM